jgi:hypothetical protein
MAATKFSEFAGGWMFCGPVILQGRIERLRALAVTDTETALVARMLTQFWNDYREDRAKLYARDGEAPTLPALDEQIGMADAPRYLGPRFRDRFQIAESVVPAGTYYIVDHGLLDLLVREDGPASTIARFPTIRAAEDRVRAIIERKPMDDTGERALKELRAKRREAALAVAREPTVEAPEIAPEAPFMPTPKAIVPAKPRSHHPKARGDDGVAPRSWVNRKPKPSMLYRELIMEGKLTDREIFAAVQERFGVERVPDTRFSNVGWYRSELRTMGKSPPGPLPAPGAEPKAKSKPEPDHRPEPKPVPTHRPEPKSKPTHRPEPVPKTELVDPYAAEIAALRAQLRALAQPAAPPPPALGLKGRMVFAPRKAAS